MNKLKFLNKDGDECERHIQQNPSPQQFSLRAPWDSPAAIKAQLLRRGFTLTGKRQARAAIKKATGA